MVVFEKLYQRKDGEPGEGIVVHDGPDKYNRYAFTEFWMADFHPGHPDGEYRHALRGQLFRMVLPRWIKDETRIGG